VQRFSGNGDGKGFGGNGKRQAPLQKRLRSFFKTTAVVFKNDCGRFRAGHGIEANRLRRSQPKKAKKRSLNWQKMGQIRPEMLDFVKMLRRAFIFSENFFAVKSFLRTFAAFFKR